jgi:hypothetical protein
MPYATVNFRFKVPIEYDEMGRRIPPVNTAIKYLEPTLVELSTARMSQDNYHYDEAKDELYVKVGAAIRHHFDHDVDLKKTIREQLEASAAIQKKRHEQQRAKIKRTYGMEWEQFAKISFTDVGTLRHKFQAKDDDTCEVELQPEEKDRLLREWAVALDLEYRETLGITMAEFKKMDYTQQYKLMAEKNLTWSYGWYTGEDLRTPEGSVEVNVRHPQFAQAHFCWTLAWASPFHSGGNRPGSISRPVV